MPKQPNESPRRNGGVAREIAVAQQLQCRPHGIQQPERAHQLRGDLRLCLLLANDTNAGRQQLVL